MKDLLESVQTPKLKGAFEKYLPAVLNTQQSQAPKKRVMVESREEIIREILQSFVAACSSRKPCEKLVIVIATKDYYDLEMNLEELGDYLLHICKYTDFQGTTVLAHGGRIS
jgi:hypothetical protein